MKTWDYTDEDWRDYCAEHTPKEAAEMLYQWVEAGQPDGFLGARTWRSMCGLTAECYAGRHGGNWDYMDFYTAMSTGDTKRMTEKHAEDRKARHIRCGIQLDGKPT